MNILLVEDDITLAMGIEYSLKNEGFNVYTVGKIKDEFRFLKRIGSKRCKRKDK